MRQHTELWQSLQTPAAAEPASRRRRARQRSRRTEARPLADVSDLSIGGTVRFSTGVEMKSCSSIVLDTAEHQHVASCEFVTCQGVITGPGGAAVRKERNPAIAANLVASGFEDVDVGVQPLRVSSVAQNVNRCPDAVPPAGQRGLRLLSRMEEREACQDYLSVGNVSRVGGQPRLLTHAFGIRGTHEAFTSRCGVALVDDEGRVTWAPARAWSRNRRSDEL